MFLFSPSQKRGILLLCLLLVSILAIYAWKNQPQEAEKTAFAFPLQDKKKTSEKIYVNQADSTDWAALPGIGAKLSSRIVKYRTSLGGFSDLEQIKNVFGLKPETYDLISPFLVLDTVEIHKPEYAQKGDKYPKYAPKEYSKLDINTANAEDFALLWGIGDVLSERIIKFRTAKKGFRNVEEISQVFGLEKEVFDKNRPYFVLNPATIPVLPEKNVGNKPDFAQHEVGKPPFPPNTDKFPKKNPEKTDINTASLEQLLQIPGIGEKTAQKIIESRQKLGFFAKAEHVKSVVFMNEENYERMKPFLFVGNTTSFSRKSLNKVQWRELADYPDMQKEMVTALINSRKLGGYFQNWEDVGKVQGMNPVTLETLKSYFVLP